MKPDTLNMIATLRTVMQVLDVRQAEIERKLGWHISHLSKILSGTVELRFEHILDVGAAMGLKPQEVFRFAYPNWGEPPSEAGRRVREITASFAGPSAPAPAGPAPQARLSTGDVEGMILKAMRRVISDKLEEEPEE